LAAVAGACPRRRTDQPLLGPDPRQRPGIERDSLGRSNEDSQSPGCMTIPSARTMDSRDSAATGPRVCRLSRSYVATRRLDVASRSHPFGASRPTTEPQWPILQSSAARPALLRACSLPLEQTQERRTTPPTTALRIGTRCAL
jgi:hypothetical protein